jgi:hypothetical protein
MAAQQNFTFPTADPFMTFWTDFWKKASTLGAGAPQPTPDAMEQIRRAFFDAMAEHAERYMRSEAFLNTLKHSMESTLAWQQQMNEFLHKNLSAAQMPSHVDTDHSVMLIRGMEDRITSRLDALSERIDRLEHGRPAAPKTPAPKAKTARGKRKQHDRRTRRAETK